MQNFQGAFYGLASFAIGFYSCMTVLNVNFQCSHFHFLATLWTVLVDVLVDGKSLISCEVTRNHFAFAVSRFLTFLNC